MNFSNADLERGWRGQRDSADTSNPENLRYQKMFKEKVATKCPTCTIELMSDRYGEPKYRVKLPDGWYFDITMDPSVIEITAKPIPLHEMPAKKEVMNSLIWDTAKDLKLQGDGAGHLNYGITSTFGDDARLFRNFMADYLNNPGLSAGVFDYVDRANAPHPEELGSAQKKALADLFRDFDPDKKSIKDFAKVLYEKVYFKSTVFGGYDGEPPEKYQSLNINSIAKEGDSWPRLELRSIGMQANADELEKLSALFAARIKYLKSQPGVIPYVGDRKFGARTPASMVEDFYRYVTESGLKWEDYREFVAKRPNMQNALTAFERTLATKKVPSAATFAVESKQNCSGFFRLLN